MFSSLMLSVPLGSRRPVSLSCMTLELREVRLAAHWLRTPSDWYRPDHVTAFERRFAEWNGSRHAFAFSSGRVGLSSILWALEIGPGDEVVIPAYTCIAVVNAVRFAGATPIYCDIELQTYGLEAAAVEARIKGHTKAILMQHLYGLVARDYEQLVNLARRRGLCLIEDCAHSTGALYKDRRVGNLGDVAFYSTEQSKVLCTIQGGITTTNNDAIARRLQEYRDALPNPDQEFVDRLLHTVLLDYHERRRSRLTLGGAIAHFRHGSRRLISTSPEEYHGLMPAHYARKMAAPTAALGLSQLERVEQYNAHRRQAARLWDAWCDRHGYAKPHIIANSVPVFLRYPVLVEPEKKRDRTWAARSLGVKLGIWFITHMHPAPSAVVDCPNADIAVQRCVNFPTLLEQHGTRILRQPRGQAASVSLRPMRSIHDAHGK